VIGLSMGNCATLLGRHHVHIDLPTDLPLLELDTGLMERVFNNLLENAAKYTPPGSTITITALLSGQFMEVVVKDNGPGFSPGMEKKLFEKFTRGKMGSTVSGFGLGLAIVRAIVEAHSGSVRAENLPEGGARFILLLPLGNPPTLPEESSDD
jgi:two-component system sensor histidine kinase KdpD